MSWTVTPGASGSDASESGGGVWAVFFAVAGAGVVGLMNEAQTWCSVTLSSASAAVVAAVLTFGWLATEPGGTAAVPSYSYSSARPNAEWPSSCSATVSHLVWSVNHAISRVGPPDRPTAGVVAPASPLLLMITSGKYGIPVSRPLGLDRRHDAGPVPVDRTRNPVAVRVLAGAEMRPEPRVERAPSGGRTRPSELWR